MPGHHLNLALEQERGLLESEFSPYMDEQPDFDEFFFQLFFFGFFGEKEHALMANSAFGAFLL